MDEIQQFSLELANNLIKCSLEEFFKMFNDEFYKDENIDFMNYFLELVPKRKEFCVEPIKLQEYKVLNNINTSGTVLRTLKQYDLEEGVDYWLYNVVQPLKGKKGGATSGYNEYRLTPSAFKLCLIRAKNSKVYAKYYMKYEEMYCYYKYYQTEYQNKVLSMKDDKIDNLEKKLDDVLKENKKQSAKIDEQSKQIKELFNYVKQTTEKLDEVKEELVNIPKEFKNLNMQFENLHEKVDSMKDTFKENENHSAPDPESETDKSEYILLQNKNKFNEFIFIRGIKEYSNKKMINTYNKDYEIVARDFNSNPIQLFNLFKKIVNDELKEVKDSIKNNNNLKGQKMRLKREAEKIKISSNKIELLNNFTMEQLLNKIGIIAETKFEKYNESAEDIP